MNFYVHLNMKHNLWCVLYISDTFGEQEVAFIIRVTWVLGPYIFGPYISVGLSSRVAVSTMVINVGPLLISD